MDYMQTRIYHVGRSTVLVGPFSYGHEHLNILQWNEGASLQIGAFCSISGGCTVYLGGNHRLDWATTYPFGHIYTAELFGPAVTEHPLTDGDVIIGNDVWIGAECTIMSGVTIGDGAVIAAKAHVVKDVPPYTIFGGNPARPIRQRFDDDVVALLRALRWWDLPPEAIREIRSDLCAPPTVEGLSALVRRYRPGAALP
ncbi:CatB-related O-acetyltransferase [Alsobacter sp. R-9]